MKEDLSAMAIALVLVLVLSLVLGGLGIAGRYIDTAADRKIFKESITYNEGMLDDLARYKYQYDTADDDTERQAIASMVRERFANYDRSKIENYQLIRFLEDCGL